MSVGGENEYIRQVCDGRAKVMGKDFYGRANWRAQTQSFRQDTGLEDYHPSLLWRQETALGMGLQSWVSPVAVQRHSRAGEDDSHRNNPVSDPPPPWPLIL